VSVIPGRAVGVPRVLVLVLLGAAMLGVQLALRGEGDARVQVVGQLAAFAVFLPAAVLCWRGRGLGRLGLAIVVVGAVAFRAAAFVPGDATPPLSGDVHRYAWDGEVQLAGINPYRYAADDPALAALRDGEIWPGINHKPWHTVYPPGAQAAFVASQATFGGHVRSSTWLLLLAEAGAIGLLLVVLRRMRAPPERVALYAWHPLAVSEIAGNGHVDALAVLALAGLLAAWGARRHALAGLCVAAAALVKLGPLLLVPALARAGGRRFVVAAVAVAVAAYVPFAATIGTGALGSLRRFEREERFNGSLDQILSAIVGRGPSQVILALGLLGVVGVVALREHATVEQVARSALLVLGGLLLAVDYVQPWHALWLTPFLAIVAAPGWMWLTGALPLAYVVKVTGGMPVWASLAIYGPVAAAALWHLRPARPAAGRPEPLPGRPRVAAIIPALDEAAAIGGILASWPPGLTDEIVVVDGGSRDATTAIARAGGARVVVEPRRGYGRACAAGAAATDAEVIVFLDGDGSCDPADLPAVLEPVLRGEAALCLGARVRPEEGAMSAHQRAGNAAVCALLRLTHGARVRDIPCMRAIRADTLASLDMREGTYGWPTEMIVKALRDGHAVAERPVSFRRRRGGRSKVTGRLGPSARAGARMLAVALRYA
jgi:alpha-1,6-mannosyltransferase